MFCSKAVLESLRRRSHIMTNGFNSCRNVVCNFTEGNTYKYSICPWFVSKFPSMLELGCSCKSWFQEPCIHSHKYAYHRKQLKLPERLAKPLMFSIASSSWKQLAFPLFQVQVSARKKGNYYKISCIRRHISSLVSYSF